MVSHKGDFAAKTSHEFHPFTACSMIQNEKYWKLISLPQVTVIKMKIVKENSSVAKTTALEGNFSAFPSRVIGIILINFNQ